VLHIVERKRNNTSWRNEMKLLHLKRRFYEALCVLHASGVSSTQKYEAALRAMKRTFGA
jgi:hypothetical protein